MSKFTITVERTVTAENQADAISQFLERPFGHGATTNIVEVHEPEPAPKTLAQKTLDATKAMVTDAAAQVGMIEQPRVCAVHQVAMRKRPSKFGRGFFWSCSQRNDDGSYCRSKPQ